KFENLHRRACAVALPMAQNAPTLPAAPPPQIRMMSLPYESIYTHGFVRTAIGIPSVRVADPAYNTERTLVLARRASAENAVLVLFPELGISAYSNDDLFQQDALLAGVEA